MLIVFQSTSSKYWSKLATRDHALYKNSHVFKDFIIANASYVYDSPSTPQ